MSYSDDDTWSTAHPDQVPASCCQTFPKGDAYCSTKDNPDVYPDVSFITLVKGAGGKGEAEGVISLLIRGNPPRGLSINQSASSPSKRELKIFEIFERG